MQTLAGIIAAAAPLIYAALGETISEKSGVVNLSLDGSILLSAMTAFAAAVASGSVLVGFAAGMAVSVAIAAVVAFSGIELRLNQIAVGFVLFLFARSLALFLGDSYVGRSGPKVPAQDVPLLSEIPFVGTVLFSHNLSVYGAYVAVVVVYVFIYRTRPGLELRGIGERPAAAFARGVPVNRLRYVYTLVGGALVGIAGAAVSLDQIAGWRENLTTNLGWIALAFVIFGGWHPVRVAIACVDLPRLAVRGRRAARHLPRARPGAHATAVPADDPHADDDPHELVPPPRRPPSALAQRARQRCPERPRHRLPSRVTDARLANWLSSVSESETDDAQVGR